jgi:tetratricopeptide (TPR) repeat protein
LPPLLKLKEKPIESLPSIIKIIEPSIVIVFTYRGRFDIALKKEEKENAILRLGSGFFISQNGDVITNYHVLQGADSAEVKTLDGKTYLITHIVAEDEKSDIIRLSVDIPSKYVRPLSLSSTVPEVGERIIVYGSPLGLENTVSDGIVSAIREVPNYGKVVQITAPVSPGSSGSPVINMKGEVIGVATFQMIEGQNLNFAIPSERIANLNLAEEKKKSITEELFKQESKEKKDSDYIYEARSKANYFLDKKEYEKALSYFEILIKINPLDSTAYSGIGFCYEELGAYTKAIEAYKQAINIDSDFAEAYFCLGLIYGGKLGFDGAKDAIEAFKQAIHIDPDNIAAHFGLGLMYLLTGDKNSALNEYKILKELNVYKANELFDMIY